MSNLLSQASLVMIPSGYKEDVVYSAIPTNGNGDLSFTRSSNGTRVNSAGLVEVCPWNFVEQSSNLGSWYNAGVTITTGITDAYGTTNAITMSNISSGNNTDYIAKFSNTMDLPVGAVINTSVYLKGSGTIGVAIERGNTGDYFFTSQIFTLTNAWVRYDFAYTLPTGTRNGIHFYVTNLTGTTATSVDICFPQINYGSTAKPYFPTTDRLNVPRLTYQNGGGGCPSLLLEKQSTNVVTYSEQFDNAAWTKLNLTVSANSVTSPDGTQNADTITDNTTNGSHYTYQFGTQTTGTAWSCYMKKGSLDYGFIGAVQTSALRTTAIINLTNGAIVELQNGSSTTGTVTAEDCGNGWYRVKMQTNANGAGYSVGTSNGAALSGTNKEAIYTGTGSGTIYLWGAQLEDSTYATSYIVSTSSSATRVADACFKTGISSLIGQGEGSVLFDFQFNADLESILMDITPNTLSPQNRLILYNPGGLLVYLIIFDNGTSTVTMASSGYSLNQRLKVGYGYKNNDVAFYINGTQIGTDTSCTMPTVTLSRVDIGNRLDGTYPSMISVNQAILFPTRLTNAELASLTTL